MQLKSGLVADAIVAATVAASPVLQAQQPGTVLPLPVTRIDGPVSRQQPALQDRMTTAASKVSVLGDLPAIGDAFRRTETTRRKTDLVILSTPRLMSPAQIPGTTARLDSAQGTEGGR